MRLWLTAGAQSRSSAGGGGGGGRQHHSHSGRGGGAHRTWEQAERFAALSVASLGGHLYGVWASPGRPRGCIRVFSAQRWAIIVGLRAASESVRDEAEAYKREIGFK
jgi:hypothetical protein